MIDTYQLFLAVVISKIKSWFWREGEDCQVFEVDELMQKYVTSVGRNTNMLLGIVVNDKGWVPATDVARLEAYGKEIRRCFGHPDKQVKGTGPVLTIGLDKPAVIDRVIVQEDITKGERVLEYVVKGKQDGRWITLSAGSSIGHKRIACFEPQRVEEVRLEVTRAKAEPQIAAFAVFSRLE